MATTNKLGDLAEGVVIADLLSQGYKVALPISSDSPIDVLALDPTENWWPIRIQVKARSAHRGKVKVIVKNCSSTRHGLKYRRLDKKTVDALAVYCPEIKAVAYVSTGSIVGQSLCLRIDAPKNGQERKIRLFREHSSLRQAVSSETIRPTPD
jgi:hypothetical protein